jgi:hypothetical protein
MKFPLVFVFACCASAANVNSIPPIHIDGNAQLAACGCATLQNGTWVIGPWSISSSPGDGVLISRM